MKLLNFVRGQFSEADARKLHDLINSPEGRTRLNEADKVKVEARAELKQRLDTLNERFDSKIEQAGIKYQEAERHLKEVRECMHLQVREAEEAYIAARSAAWALEHEKNKEEFDTRRELYDSRDTRVDDYHMHLGNALSMVNHCVKVWPKIVGYHEYNGKALYGSESNGKEVSAAMELIKGAQKKLEDMLLLPLTLSEISEQLTSISRELAPTFKRFSQPLPVLNADGEVELSSPRLTAYMSLKANDVATSEDGKQVNVLAAGGSVLGDRGSRRVRSARASGNAWGRSMTWLRYSKQIDDLEDK
ncbi:hypothetical protein WJ41_05055 [Burkholderia ubonensis]|uniref:hypothetical protein n=1 Tax=Burkholderia ubonensis TaxID=101571 RepID=UPI00075A6E5B|nr:hypothetical protein [Burkholderia ubonensis]KVH77573.1 hypothetical protein WJ41_05055 [Burkholderia ubonensis]KVU11043.1 hypothetical protein WK61_01645 [Burkholderia ubonensis]